MSTQTIGDVNSSTDYFNGWNFKVLSWKSFNFHQYNNHQDYHDYYKDNNDKNKTSLPTSKIETYYLYNSSKGMCLCTLGKLGTQLTYGECDYSVYSLWDIPRDTNGNHKGKFYSKVNSNYCVRLLNVSKGTLILNECEMDWTTFYRENHSVLSSLLIDKCIGIPKSDLSIVGMTNCNAGHSDQVWYFNIWTINPTNPRTVTVSSITTTTTTKKKTTTTTNQN